MDTPISSFSSEAGVSCRLGQTVPFGIRQDRGTISPYAGSLDIRDPFHGHDHPSGPCVSSDVSAPFRVRPYFANGMTCDLSFLVTVCLLTRRSSHGRCRLPHLRPTQTLCAIPILAQTILRYVWDHGQRVRSDRPGQW